MQDLPEEEKAGTPAWVVTFADLMSLLMCFFVLLLSFSEIDAMKFRQIAQELSKAFGVQREVPALETPQGTSPVFQHFSPGRPDPTALDEVRQTTTTRELNLETQPAPDPAATADTDGSRTLEHALTLQQVLQTEIDQGQIDLRVDEGQQQVIIRIEERGSFPSGSAELSYGLVDLLVRMGRVLTNVPGDLTVEGHTDNIPIRSGRYDSNWNLSADRAAAVANALIEAGPLDENRFRVLGLAATRPRAENTTDANRAMNRRVEVILDLSQAPREGRSRVDDLPPVIILDTINSGQSDLELSW